MHVYVIFNDYTERKKKKEKECERIFGGLQQVLGT